MDATHQQVIRIEDGRVTMVDDELAPEEPLEIRVAFTQERARGVGYAAEAVAVTMRTPGNDRQLALGFLFAEGMISTLDEVAEVRTTTAAPGCIATVTVTLAGGRGIDLGRLDRRGLTNSSCGLCGRTDIDAIIDIARTLRSQRQESAQGPRFGAETLAALPGQLRAAQTLFRRTGGLHGCGLFDAEGRLMSCFEDVGRHNALDKLIGAALEEHTLPLLDHAVLLSGRVSFELVQKAAMAGVPILAAVGAPSSLAAQTAIALDMTLVGFLRGRRFCIYHGADRIAGAAQHRQRDRVEAVTSPGPSR